MRESRTSGSVRGARGNSRPYRVDGAISSRFSAVRLHGRSRPVELSFDPTNPSEIAQFAAIQSVAPLLGMSLSPLDVRDASEIGRAVGTFARQPNGGLIVTGSNSAIAHRDLIVTLAVRYGLPAVYPARVYVTSGGLISYGPE